MTAGGDWRVSRPSYESLTLGERRRGGVHARAIRIHRASDDAVIAQGVQHGVTANQAVAVVVEPIARRLSIKAFDEK